MQLVCDGVTRVLEHTEQVSFGRAPGVNDIVIGSATRQPVEDTLVSRRAGLVVNEHPWLLVRNVGSALPLTIEPDAGVRRVVESGDELRLLARCLTISVQGRVRRYVVEVEVATPGFVEPNDVASIAPTERPIRLSADRRLDLAALCAPMFGAHRSGKPASYAQAAALRGVTRKAMEKRVEHLAADLRERVGLPGLEPGAEVKQVICDWAIRTGLVTTVELASLSEPL